MSDTTLASTAPAVVRGGSSRPSRFEAPSMWDGQDQSSKDKLLGWMREAINEGEWFLKGNSGYQFVDASHRLMADIGLEELPATLSKTSLNFVKRDVREVVATLANPRPINSFVSLNQAYDDQCGILNKGYRSWYGACDVDRTIRDAVYFAAVEGTGYLLTEWDPGYWANGLGDVRVQALGVDAVLPIQISPEGWDLRQAYAVIIRRQVPFVYLANRYPWAANTFVPDGENVSRWRRLVNRLMDKVTPTVHNTYGSQRGYRGEDPAGKWLVTVYDIYILDRAINTTGQEIKMGLEGSPWQYRVPTMGGDIPMPYNNPDGSPVYRKAGAFDSKMFPYRRHIVATRNMILSDGPSKWWHGQVPLVKIALDSNPAEYCGIPLTKEPAKLQMMVTSLLRAYDDSANARLRPPIAYDDSRMAEGEARQIDPRVGGQVVAIRNMLSEPFKMLVDPRIYQQGSDILPLIQWAKEEGTKLIGLHDLTALQRAAQIPSADTIEKLNEMAGPLATDMSRNMETALKGMGEQFKALFFEFYSAPRRFQLLGPDGLTPEDFDYDPGELTPDNISLPGIGTRGNRVERARAHMQNFRFDIVPNTIYEMTQSSRKLLLLQLGRMGLPVSPYTILEQYDLPNVGRPPKVDGVEPQTEIEKWKAWKKEETDVMIEQQMKMAQAQMEMQAQAAAANPMAQLGQALQQMVQSPTVKNPQGEGRPPTAQRQPHMEAKDNGTRMAISES